MTPRLKCWLVAEEVPPGWEASLRAENWACVRAKDASDCLGPAWALVERRQAGSVGPLRRSGVRPIVFGPLESMPASEVIACLEAGADDVVSSSIPGKLLVAKLKAHARAAAPAPAGVLWSPRKTLKLDLVKKRAYRKVRASWKPVEDLTRTEFEILGLLLRQTGAPVERRDILETLWREEALEVRSDSVNKHVQALRRKLDAHGAYVKAMYGVGYAYRED